MDLALVSNNPPIILECVKCGHKNSNDREPYYTDLHGKPFVDYYCELCMVKVAAEHGIKRTIGVDLLRENLKRNGEMQMLADVAEAKKTGVPFSAEAEEYLVKVITNDA